MIIILLNICAWVQFITNPAFSELSSTTNHAAKVLTVWVMFPHCFFGVLSAMHQPTPLSKQWILSQQTVTKCLLQPWKQAHTSFQELPLLLRAFLKRRTPSVVNYLWYEGFGWEQTIYLYKTEFMRKDAFLGFVWDRKIGAIRYLPAAALGRLNRLFWHSLTDACQSDALWWFLLFPSAQGSVQVYGPILEDTHRQRREWGLPFETWPTERFKTRLHR